MSRPRSSAGIWAGPAPEQQDHHGQLIRRGSRHLREQPDDVGGPVDGMDQRAGEDRRAWIQVELEAGDDAEVAAAAA